MPVLYANNAASRLAASITNVATSFSVTAGHGARFPAISGGDYFYATLMDSAGNLEVVKVTARATDTFTVARAQEGTTARAYAVNDIVELRITKLMLDDFKTDTRAGNAATATALQNARTIGGVSFNGTANINLPGVNAAGNQNTSGTAAVSTAATITTSTSAFAFKVPFANTTVSTTGNYGLLQDSEATFTYNPSTNTLVVGTVSAALSGNATTATTLQTARTINGVSFNGSANITVADSTKLPLAGGTLTGALTGTTLSTSGAGGSFIVVGRDNAAQNFQMYVTGNVWRVFSSTAATDRLNLDSAGNMVVSGNVTANSDERLKRDWVALPSDFIERLATVKSGTYTRIDTNERQAGSSAQDWQKLLPEAVMTGADEDRTLSLAYGNAALVSAVELAKRVVRLEQLIEKLIGD
jgi:hypothetical protein